MARTALRRGTVTAFDDDAGLGTVTDDAGQEHPFHCTAIAGGVRTIEEGTDVAFTLVARHHGRWEADGITPV